MATPNYWDYLKITDLLELQGGLEGGEVDSSDELHFIIVHQVFELWFKLTLRELRHARDHLAAPDVPEEHIPSVVHHLGRLHRILEVCRNTFGVMETLTTQDFLAFRDKLIPASGFQSFQMRELEILLGLQRSQRETTPAGLGDPVEAIRKLGQDSPRGPAAVGKLDAVQKEQTLRSALHDWLYRTPIQGSTPDQDGDAEAVDDFLNAYLVASAARAASNRARLVEVGVMQAEAAEAKFAETSEAARAFLFAEDTPEDDRMRVRRVRAAILFIESYRELPLLAWPRLLLDAIVELEEALVLFRTRHARMVERIIGRRVGTGGSSGVDYLDATTKYRIFTELWAVRTVLLARDALPPLLHAEAYGFAR